MIETQTFNPLETHPREVARIVEETDREYAAGDTLDTLESPPQASAYMKRRMAQRDVLQAISIAHERAATEGNPELGQAYYDAMTVLLEHWTVSP